MSKASRLFCLVLILASVGSVQWTGPASGKSLYGSSAQDPHATELRRVYKSAYALVAEGKYLQAEDLFQQLFAQFKALGDLPMAGRCLTSVGGAQFLLFQYRAALNTYLQARGLAEAGKDWANVATLNSNISALLLQMGDLDAAAHSAESALADFNRKNFPGGKSRCLIQLGVIRARQGKTTESAGFMREAVDSAYSEGDLSIVADAWDHLGEEYLARRELPSAEAALTEAFRVRKVHGLTHLTNSYFNLGRLRLAQGDLRSASVLLDDAIRRQTHTDSWINLWSLYHVRGQANLASGRARAAFNDFEKALELAREWRLEVLPADFTRISSEGELEEIYSSFIESANELYLASGSSSELAAESFRAAEENRGASLHALLREANDWRASLPDEYWQTLAQLHNAEVSLLQKDDVGLRERMQQLRSRLLLAEARAGSTVELSSDKLLDRVKENLPPDTALLSFHLGEPQSFLWAVSRKRFRLYPLPDKPHLAAGIKDFVKAVQTRQDSATYLGRKLYDELFGRLEPHFRDKPQWILALDEQLFRVPFGALVVDSAGPVYLAEQHTVRVTTGAVMLAADGRHRTWNELLGGGFVGVGDAIYNTADPRWRQPRHQGAVSFPGVVFAASEGSTRQGWALARLAGSAREIERCARTWDAQSSILLEGPDAAPSPLRQALQTGPSIVHIAAHFLQGNDPPRDSLIALSLIKPGDLQMLSPLEITRFKFDAGVVVLSGCSSGRADVLPASGLMGLTRAWLAGGARAVVASHWPTPDDSGPLFVSFYQHLHQTPEAGPAAALQGAQRDILRAGGWRSNPQYWATYFVVGD
jgi:CHAT domain-containing protein